LKQINKKKVAFLATFFVNRNGASFSEKKTELKQQQLSVWIGNWVSLT